jgi:hypothetical protein
LFQGYYLLNLVYARLRLSTIEFELARLPIPAADILAKFFRVATKLLILVAVPVGVVFLSPILVLFGAWRMRDADSTAVVVLDRPKAQQPTGVVLLNSFPGS